MTDKTQFDAVDRYFRLALEYTKQEKFDQAIKTYQTAIAINPNQATIYNNLGLLYAQKVIYSKQPKHI